MPRLARQNITAKFLHVMVQGINKSYIFENSIEKKKYIRIMYEVKKNCNISIIAYAVMDNHVHILIKYDDIKDVSHYMHKLNTTYALFYNNIHKRVGYVFRDRFKSEGIMNENHLFNCIRYIFENPVKANICDHPEKYDYSNYKYFKMKDKLYTTDVMCDNFIDTEEDKENIVNKIIEKVLREKSISKAELIKHKKILKRIIKILTADYNFSSRKIEKMLDISRETVRKLK